MVPPLSCMELFITRREVVGRPISVADAMIAATARAYSLAIATRNGGDFAGCGYGSVWSYWLDAKW